MPCVTTVASGRQNNSASFYFCSLPCVLSGTQSSDSSPPEKEMEEGKVLSEDHLTSAAAFVEGGIQEACDDACSICLEAFCESDPSTMTSCKHEFHLQCILEWCQRSSQCPMCWQSISLKDPSSQELLDAVEHERNMRINPPRNTAIFHHPALGEFELQHVPVSASDSELEERIIQHLAAAAAMGRARQLARREGQRSRSSTQGRPQFLVFSSNPNPTSANSPALSPAQRGGPGPLPAAMIASPNSPFITLGEDSAQLITPQSFSQADHITTASGSGAVANQLGTSSSNWRSPAQTSPNSQDRAGPSDFQSFSETLKSRLSALSVRYKESITKSTRGWKERLFARNISTPEPGTEIHREVDFDRNISVRDGLEVRREVDPGTATVSRMMDYLEISEDSRTDMAPISNNLDDNSTSDTVESETVEMGGNSPLTKVETRATCAASSTSN